MHSIELPLDYAVVLRQVGEAGEEDLLDLTESLNLDRPRARHIVKALRNKGLLSVRYTAQETWISLSSRGRRLLGQIWPEMRYGYGF